MTVEAGLRASLRHTVADGELDLHWGGCASVLSSPHLIGRIEMACMKATDHLIDENSMTVGVGFDLRHKAPTPLGWEIAISVIVSAVERNRLTFEVSACDKAGIIAEGRHIRAIVDRESFLAKLAERSRCRGPAVALPSTNAGQEGPSNEAPDHRR